METCSSTRSTATSQPTAAAAANFREQKQARAALLDITNDSPIIGLTTALLLPQVKALQSASQSRVRTKARTPGSGEEVLRGQVRTLLQKVEEDESELGNKPAPPFGHSSTCHELTGLARTLFEIEALFPADQDVQVRNLAELLEPPECKISRALMFDSPEKSGLSVEESSGDDGDLLGELCEGMKKVSMADDHEIKPLRLPEFTGRHIRFIYRSDDELEGEEEVNDGKEVSPGVLLLKALPAPEGKHLRFHDDDDDDEEEA